MPKKKSIQKLSADLQETKHTESSTLLQKECMKDSNFSDQISEQRESASNSSSENSLSTELSRIADFFENLPNKYVEAMRTLRTYWGGDLELNAIARIYQASIAIQLTEGYTINIGDTNAQKKIHLKYTDNHYDVYDERGTGCIHIHPDGDCLFNACIQGKKLSENPDFTLSQSSRSEISELRKDVCDLLEQEPDSIIARYQCIINAETVDELRTALADLQRAPCIDEALEMVRIKNPRLYELYRMQENTSSNQALGRDSSRKNTDNEANQNHDLSDIIDSIMQITKEYKSKQKNSLISSVYYRTLMELYGFALALNRRSKDESIQKKIKQKIIKAIHDFANEALGLANSDLFLADMDDQITNLRIRLKAHRVNVTSRVQELGSQNADVIAEHTAMIKKEWQDLLDDIFDSAYNLNSGKRYCAIVGLGSLAHGFVTPYSDIEYLILIENSTDEPHFRACAFLLEYILIALGESPLHQALPLLQRKFGDEFDTYQKLAFPGMHLDRHKTPGTECFSLSLIGTPESLSSQLLGRLTHQPGNHLSASLLSTMLLKHANGKKLYDTWLKLSHEKLYTEEGLSAIKTLLNKDMKSAKALHAKLSLQLGGHAVEDPVLEVKLLLSRLLHLVQLIGMYYAGCEKKPLPSNPIAAITIIEQLNLKELSSAWQVLVHELYVRRLKGQMSTQSARAPLMVSEASSEDDMLLKKNQFVLHKLAAIAGRLIRGSLLTSCSRDGDAPALDTDMYQLEDLNSEKKEFLDFKRGFSDFKTLVRGQGFIDKSLFIKALMDENEAVQLIVRPFRFGKTTLMSMLNYFFSCSEQSAKELFVELKIYKEEKNFCDCHQNKYPVIYFSFAKFTGDNLLEGKQSIWMSVGESFRAFKADLSSSTVIGDGDRQWYEMVLKEIDDAEKNPSKNVVKRDITNAICRLMKMLETHYSKKVIVLIDEYDKPIHVSHEKHYYKEMCAFISILFQSIFKDNPARKFGVITGVFRISNEEIFSGWNNHVPNTVANDHTFAPYFGLTATELELLAEKKRKTIEGSAHCDYLSNLEDWFGGYELGVQKICNLWPVSYYFKDNKHKKSCWAEQSKLVGNTLTNMQKNSPETYKKCRAIFDELRQGGSYSLKIAVHMELTELDYSSKSSNGSSAPSSKTPVEAFFSLLVLGGYLTIKRESLVKEETELVIPNLEVHEYFTRLFKSLEPNLAGLPNDITNFIKQEEPCNLNYSSQLRSSDMTTQKQWLKRLLNKTYLPTDAFDGLLELLETARGDIRTQLLKVLKKHQKDHDSSVIDKYWIMLGSEDKAVMEFAGAQLDKILTIDDEQLKRYTAAPQFNWVVKCFMQHSNPFFDDDFFNFNCASDYSKLEAIVPLVRSSFEKYESVLNGVDYLRWSRLLLRISYYYFLQNNCGEALVWIIRTESVLEKNEPLSGESINWAYPFLLKGQILQGLALLSDARDAFELVLNLRDKTYQSWIMNKSPNVDWFHGIASSCLAYLDYLEGDYQASEQGCKKAIELKEKVGSKISASEPEIAISYIMYGLLLTASCQYQLAKRYLDKAEQLLEKYYGNKHVDKNKHLYWGMLRYRQGVLALVNCQINNANIYFNEAAGAFNPHDHNKCSPSFLMAKLKQAQVLLHQNKLAQAITLLESIKHRENFIDNNDYNHIIGDIFATLGELFIRSNNSNNAWNCFLNSLDRLLHPKSVGKGYRVLELSSEQENNIEVILNYKAFQMSQYDAREVYAYQRIRHLKAAVLFRKLATIEVLKGHENYARELLKEALSISIAVFGENEAVDSEHIIEQACQLFEKEELDQPALALFEWAKLDLGVGRFKVALNLLQRVLAIQRAATLKSIDVQTDTHTDINLTRCYIARTYMLQRQLNDAEKELKFITPASDYTQLGDIIYVTQLAGLFYHRGSYRKALNLINDVLESNKLDKPLNDRTRYDLVSLVVRKVTVLAEMGLYTAAKKVLETLPEPNNPREVASHRRLNILINAGAGQIDAIDVDCPNPISDTESLVSEFSTLDATYSKCLVRAAWCHEVMQMTNPDYHPTQKYRDANRRLKLVENRLTHQSSQRNNEFNLFRIRLLRAFAVFKIGDKLHSIPYIQQSAKLYESCLLEIEINGEWLTNTRLLYAVSKVPPFWPYDSQCSKHERAPDKRDAIHLRAADFLCQTDVESEIAPYWLHILLQAIEWIFIYGDLDNESESWSNHLRRYFSRLTILNHDLIAAYPDSDECKILLNFGEKLRSVVYSSKVEKIDVRKDSSNAIVAAYSTFCSSRLPYIIELAQQQRATKQNISPSGELFHPMIAQQINYMHNQKDGQIAQPSKIRSVKMCIDTGGLCLLSGVQGSGRKYLAYSVYQEAKTNNEQLKLLMYPARSLRELKASLKDVFRLLYKQAPGIIHTQSLASQGNDAVLASLVKNAESLFFIFHDVTDKLVVEHTLNVFSGMTHPLILTCEESSSSTLNLDELDFSSLHQFNSNIERANEVRFDIDLTSDAWRQASKSYIHGRLNAIKITGSEKPLADYLSRGNLNSYCQTTVNCSMGHPMLLRAILGYFEEEFTKIYRRELSRWDEGDGEDVHSESRTSRDKLRTALRNQADICVDKLKAQLQSLRNNGPKSDKLATRYAGYLKALFKAFHPTEQQVLVTMMFLAGPVHDQLYKKIISYHHDEQQRVPIKNITQKLEQYGLVSRYNNEFFIMHPLTIKAIQALCFSDRRLTEKTVEIYRRTLRLFDENISYSDPNERYIEAPFGALANTKNLLENLEQIKNGGCYTPNYQYRAYYIRLVIKVLKYYFFNYRDPYTSIHWLDTMLDRVIGESWDSWLNIEQKSSCEIMLSKELLCAELYLVKEYALLLLDDVEANDGLEIVFSCYNQYLSNQKIRYNAFKAGDNCSINLENFSSLVGELHHTGRLMSQLSAIQKLGFALFVQICIVSRSEYNDNKVLEYYKKLLEVTKRVAGNLEDSPLAQIILPLSVANITLEMAKRCAFGVYSMYHVYDHALSFDREALFGQADEYFKVSEEAFAQHQKLLQTKAPQSPRYKKNSAMMFVQTDTGNFFTTGRPRAMSQEKLKICKYTDLRLVESLIAQAFRWLAVCTARTEHNIGKAEKYITEARRYMTMIYGSEEHAKLNARSLQMGIFLAEAELALLGNRYSDALLIVGRAYHLVLMNKKISQSHYFLFLSFLRARVLGVGGDYHKAISQLRTCMQLSHALYDKNKKAGLDICNKIFWNYLCASRYFYQQQSGCDEQLKLTEIDILSNFKQGMLGDLTGTSSTRKKHLDLYKAQMMLHEFVERGLSVKASDLDKRTSVLSADDLSFSAQFQHAKIRADVLFQSQRYTEAKNHYLQVLNLPSANGDFTDVNADVIFCHINSAFCYIELNQISNAFNAFKQALVTARIQYIDTNMHQHPLLRSVIFATGYFLLHLSIKCNYIRQLEVALSAFDAVKQSNKGLLELMYIQQKDMDILVNLGPSNGQSFVYTLKRSSAEFVKYCFKIAKFQLKFDGLADKPKDYLTVITDFLSLEENSFKIEKKKLNTTPSRNNPILIHNSITFSSEIDKLSKIWGQQAKTCNSSNITDRNEISYPASSKRDPNAAIMVVRHSLFLTAGSSERKSDRMLRYNASLEKLQKFKYININGAPTVCCVSKVPPNGDCGFIAIQHCLALQNKMTLLKDVSREAIIVTMESFLKTGTSRMKKHVKDVYSRDGFDNFNDWSEQFKLAGKIWLGNHHLKFLSRILDLRFYICRIDTNDIFTLDKNDSMCGVGLDDIVADIYLVQDEVTFSSKPNIKMNYFAGVCLKPTPAQKKQIETWQNSGFDTDLLQGNFAVSKDVNSSFTKGGNSNV